MKSKPKTKKQSRVEIEDLRMRLEEAEETLRAIRRGEVDGLVVSGPQGDQVFALKGAELPYRVFVEAMNEGAVTLGPDGTILYCNNRFAEMLKTSLERAIGSPIYRFIDPADKGMFESMIGKERTRSELYLQAEDGTSIPAYVSVTPLEIEEVQSFFIVVTDLTEQKLVEDAVKAEHAFRESIERSLISGIYAVDLKGRLLYVNPAFRQMVGWNQEELIGATPPLIYWPPEEIENIEKAFQSATKGEIHPGGCELRFRRKNGERFDVLVLRSPLKDGRGETIGWVGSVGDITERKRMEEALRESGRQLRHLSSELLTAQEKERKRISSELHDSVAASLTAIKLGMESILSQLEGGSPACESLKTQCLHAQATIEETRRIMADLRPSVLDDLGIVPATSWLCREFQKLHSSIDIAKEIEIEEDDVPDNLKTAIFRICQEALNNIAKHSKAGLVNLLLRRSDGMTELTIQDDGQGFDPGKAISTTGAERRFGLISMKERAELLGGFFKIESIPGKGTTIKATWPI